MTDEHRASDQLETALRAWAKAPPRTPAAEAARRVRARISEGRQPSHAASVWRGVALACALVLSVVAATLLWRGPGPSPAVTSATDVPPVLPENVVVFWLDADTPVYFVVGPVGDAPGGTP